MNIIILGAPGSGKGTQAAMISRKHELAHISTGDLLREAVAEGTELGKQVESILRSGKLVSDEVVLQLIREATSKSTKGNRRGWILDGYPRTVAQAESLETVLEEIGQKVDSVIVLDVNPDVIVERLSNRRTCESCKAVYNLLNNPPRYEGKCDICGHALIQREDDKANTIRKRLDVYNDRTRPIIHFYDGRYRIHRIDGTQPIDEVSAAIARLVSE
ncbi:MAG: adenylate kinase [Candidatus Latescibacteria bacterium]|nr:adenylate kinase [Candidatus Latescibacterota bacterium]NIM20805.1 adenylate kinase [Candidatus Latescibacterota bacterium]NIM64371.1 adenylate kinase [Candidatus Latescibacterota bacterium]NIO00522.1 adenylate kinase [Candidatus Latescibacterota bacterium]NIO26925.1 adenylate kinase [Candidatus Latescibacterota bacterium]